MEWIKKALELIESGQVEEGLAALSKSEKSADHDQKFAIAEVYYELGHLKETERIVNELLALYPDEGSLIIFAAEVMIDGDKEDEAIEWLLEIKEDDPTYLQAQLLLADLYQMQSLDEVAEQKLLQAAKAAPDEVIISYGLGEFYLERGDYNKSIPHLKKAVHRAEELPNIEVDLKMAEAYSASGQFEEALVYYEKGLKDHLEPHALFGYGFTAYQVGDMTLAIEQLEALKALDPDFSSLYPYLAKALEAENRLEEAMDILKDGMSVDEYNEELYIMAGKLSFKRQRPDEGELYLRKVIALNPSNLEAVQTLAAYLKHTEQFDQLVELMTHTKSYGEIDPLLTWYEGAALRELEEYDEALHCYQEVSDHFNGDEDFLYEYASFLLEEGQREKAAAAFKQLLHINPDRSDVTEMINQLELD
ncbi:tetratricopeptide repeat protein [Alkalihalophilus marmarensis]|uniref:tetratricopeptide repeat protein n=1 Tax=Alkalihalophilus marmarensis TaxID=521377 RepID=UPI002DBCFEDD|nr:tetratricopeptide repeat protein [Alkalihalophilus marmarensis]MEC2070832.1 tetratricopeptide repeat protein [Alkalihalophilus marmarensis]